jgi:uncharacterized protein
VDYLIEIHSKIVPIEVKAGKKGRLKSLKLFMQEKKLNQGVVISQAPLERKEDIIYLPFYLISQSGRILGNN